jgi:hypothetical protein
MSRPRAHDTAETLPMPTAVDPTPAARSRVLFAFGVVFLLAAVTLVIVAQSTTRRAAAPILISPGN